MGLADFRVRGRIFATLRPEDGRTVVKLAPDQQEVLIAAEPAVFAAIPGHWGRQGWTGIVLRASDEPALQSALAMAWRNVAPRRLALALDRAARG